MALMGVTTTIDKAGRVVIPRNLRDELRLEPGDTIELESEGGRVTLRPVRSATPLRKERGVWVFHGRSKLSQAEAEGLVRDARRRRDRSQAGSDG
jgi:AbrB family looped-hinge helix DNA binding protein